MAGVSLWALFREKKVCGPRSLLPASRPGPHSALGIAPCDGVVRISVPISTFQFQFQFQFSVPISQFHFRRRAASSGQHCCNVRVKRTQMNQYGLAALAD